ncbi:MAG: alpha/beta fold hydrolase [Notoacmeibacter sp.]|nr:alpha/beta fold hydrolase [Notoacmeibacter sp.]
MPDIRFFRDSTGANIAYAVHGEGPLVICPPWWVSHVEKDWTSQPFREFFGILGEGLRVLRYDRPGVGLSDRKSGPGTFEDEVRLLQEVADVAGETGYGLFAASFGGPIVIHHAVGHPEHVRRICFFGSFMDGSDLGTPEIRQAFLAVVHAHWGMAARAIADVLFPDEPRETVRFSAQMMRDSASAKAAGQILEMAYNSTSSGIVEHVAADCLVLHREEDRAVPYEAGRALASRLRKSRLVTCRGTAHPPWFQGAVVARLANSFLRGAGLDEASTDPGQPLRDPACRLDVENRSLVVEGRIIDLTPLEYGVLRLLVDRANQVVTRDVLLAEVWNKAFEGSNRIDVVISALRKKLANWAPSVETVTGHGYRFTRWQQKLSG